MNLFTLMGVIAINAASAHKTLDSTAQKAHATSGKMDKSFEKISQAAKKCGQAIAAGLAVGTAAFAKMMKTAIGEYAEYEQLVGGVQKLFGDSASTVMKYASEAYKTAGMSANDYMQTVTSFSASLISGLGGDTERASELANMAIVAMADNVSTFGSEMSSVQDAFQGFAKQNYSMLDNLKLGYGGSAAEMARLINDSGVLGEAFTVTADTVNQVSFDKIIEAIHVIQTNMEITGTTSKEAASTLAGSFSMMKASWTNLLTGLATEDADMETLVDNFIGSTEQLASNAAKLLPRLKKSIGTVATRLMDDVGQRIRTGWNDTIWPFIRDQMFVRFGVELPDWATVRSRIQDWWEIAQPILDNTCQWWLKFAGISEWTTADTQAVIDKLTEIGIAAWQGISNFISNPQQYIGDGAFDPEEVGDNVGAWLDNQIENAHQNPWMRFGLLGALARPLDAGIDYYEERNGRPGAFAEGVSNVVAWGGRAVQTVAGWFAPDTEANMQGELDDMDLSVDVEVNPVQQQSWWSRLFGGGSGSSGGGYGRGFANGLYRVPYDGFQATLHKDEAVLNRLDAREWRSANAHGYGGDNSRLEGLMANMINLMQQVVANTGAGQTVVLDTGVLVGQMAPGMDRQLGAIANRRGALMNAWRNV